MKRTSKVQQAIFKFLFPEFYEEWELLSRLHKSISEKNRTLVKTVHRLNQCIVFGNEALSKGRTVLGIENNKLHPVVVIKVVKNNSLDINLYNPTTKTPELSFISAKIIHNKNTLQENYIEIIDICMRDINQGSGSVAMKYLIKEAKKIGASKIVGRLSEVDKD